MNKILILISLFIGVVFAACEKTEKVDNFPKHTSQLVANCFFSPDTSFVFKLSKSLSPIDNAPFKALNSTNAYIKIFENGLLFDSFRVNMSSNSFNGKKQPSANNNYRFECTYPGFGVVSSEDYLPDTVGIAKISGFYTVLRSFMTNDSTIDGEFSRTMNIEFSKPTQYLIILIEYRQHRSYTIPGRIYGGGYTYGNNVFEDLNKNNESEFAANTLFVSNPNGVSILNLKWNKYYNSQHFKSKPNFDYYITTYACSKSAFEYLKRSGLQYDNFDDPFSQPTPISNNISNGYGVFGGINKTKNHVLF